MKFIFAHPYIMKTKDLFENTFSKFSTRWDGFFISLLSKISITSSAVDSFTLQAFLTSGSK